MKLQNYALGQWVEGTGKSATLLHAVTGEPVAEASSGGRTPPSP
jgi:oxepin-CoA hydrolase / 3-oxo-5,6-dehydrosuberyl-CoA semialdehyde dehydrogenase